MGWLEASIRVVGDVGGVREVFDDEMRKRKEILKMKKRIGGGRD